MSESINDQSGELWSVAERREGNWLYVETGQHIRRVTMNRPDQLNAISRGLRAELIEEFLLFGEDPDLRVLILTAVGDRAFSAGGDLKEIPPADEPRQHAGGPMLQTMRTLFEVVAETDKPTIAALNGLTIGAGLEMALGCDIRLAAEGARFGLPEAKVAQGATFGSVVLPRRIPVGIALEMLYTGDFVSAEQALSWGLVNHVYPADQLPAEAVTLALRIAANAPITVRRMKEMALKGLSLPVPAALRLNVGPNPYDAEDRLEGIAAFREKRPPNWSGR